MNMPVACKILSKEQVGNDLYSMICSWGGIKPSPGQFVMVWIVGSDEIPMSVSLIEEGRIGFTFRVVGDATKALSQMGEGSCIGLRGPYGNGFDCSKYSKVLFVGGGTGIASIVAAVESFVGESVVVIGARCKDQLVGKNRLESSDAKVVMCTDDGSCGQKAFTSEVVERLLDDESFDLVVMCGPEAMMKKIYDLCRKKTICVQASLERFMKCAVGLCGQCCIGEGMRVCVDGPVFDESQLALFDDFGAFSRDASGKKVNL